MKRIATLLIITGLVYLSSCSNNNTNTNLNIIPSVDSVSKGSFVDLTFGFKTFKLNDWIVQNSAVITTTATLFNIAPDSFWSTSIIETDHLGKTISLNLSVLRDSTDPTGIYFVTTNGSTLTDFSGGENKTYSISIGSYAILTEITAEYVTGTLNLNLYYNHDTTLAYGSFKIFH